MWKFRKELMAYKNIKPYETGFLKVDSIHTLYYEVSGNPDGIPVLFIHGGPGGGTSERCREFFDPEFYKIVIFDQRGCGKSTPSGELRNNTTQDLINDIELLREKLNIEKMILFGGSWGSTLSLVYAIAHPERVIQMVLRGIFLCRWKDIDFLYEENGASNFFPFTFAKYKDYVDKHNPGVNSILTRYYELMTCGDYEKEVEAALHFANLENTAAVLVKNPDYKMDPKHAYEIGRIEAHYFVNNSFLPSNNFILENTSKIEHIKTRIVHGRFDTVCLPSAAYDLHKKLPNSELYLTEATSHSAFEKANFEKLCEFMEQIKQEYTSQK
ncbi:prolyl aminopeptidase [Mycoplasmopsis pullorum]|nr:prolyl aminopeptidase [Mycoplasmopsis pullorum]TNK82747.1 prolyl aminopeptidase [Mycoplasmopsis pullorum]TNK84129.1 prolyl aminopeptidase [Mycoplasmopsis pullorum]TNK85138.1 prolyl aminopeptidase [Mycoplasmopsis pullorum]TNK85378.1 prolyl aminopeptidase [Mycoplasmopsis pullorum]